MLIKFNKELALVIRFKWINQKKLKSFQTSKIINVIINLFNNSLKEINSNISLKKDKKNKISIGVQATVENYEIEI